MENITSFDTAKLLKVDGFPQPSPAAGQYWYLDKLGAIGEKLPPYVVNFVGTDDVYFSPIGVAFSERSHVGHRLPKEKFSASAVFAPTSSDILSTLYPEGSRDVSSMDMMTMALFPEKAAERWMYGRMIDTGLNRPVKHPLYDEWVMRNGGETFLSDIGPVLWFGGNLCLCGPHPDGAKLKPVNKDGDIGLGPGVGGVVTLIKLPGSSTVVASLDVSHKIGSV